MVLLLYLRGVSNIKLREVPRNYPKNTLDDPKILVDEWNYMGCILNITSNNFIHNIITFVTVKK